MFPTASMRTWLVATILALPAGWAPAQPDDLARDASRLRGELAGIIDTRLVVIAEDHARRTSTPSRLVASEAERQYTELSLVDRPTPDTVGIRVTTSDPVAMAGHLKELGATHVYPVPMAYLVECHLPVDRIADLAELVPMGLRAATANLTPATSAGSATSQADWVMEANRVRASVPGYDGTGIRIGTLSDSYNFLGGAPAGVASGDLPNDVVVLEDSLVSGRIDEGRAMIELMHDLVPGADQTFATAFSSEAGFANNIRRLADPADGNCSVIVDDVYYFFSPFFQNSIVGMAINEVVDEHDVVYLCAAGNLADRAYERIAPQTAADPAGLAGVFHDFDPGPGIDTRQRFTLPANTSITVIVQWDDPYFTLNGVDTDIDVLARNTSGSAFFTVATNNITNQQPAEGFQVNAGSSSFSFDLMLRLTTGPAPGRLKYVFMRGSQRATEHLSLSSTVVSHAGAERCAPIAAINFYNQGQPASFSSFGPNTILFTDIGLPIPGGEVRQTPIMAAMQDTDTTFFISSNNPDGNAFPNFNGTSAAAPHAAAVAAMIRQRFPDMNRDQVIERMIAGCDPSISTPGFDNITGHGSLNAYDAVFGPPTANLPPIAEGLEGGALPLYWETRTTNNGRVVATNANGPAVGVNHLTMDANYTATASLNTATLHTSLAGHTNVQLSFQTREFNDSDDPMPATFTTASDSDGVAYSVDGGTTWKSLVSLTGAESTNTYAIKNFDLSSVASANGDTLGADVRIRFQQFGTQAIPNQGIAFDDIVLTSVFTPLGFDIDTDGDGYSDGYEQARSSEPLVNASRPSPLLGDIDSDGDVDSDDVSTLALALALAGNTPLTAQRAGIVDDNASNLIIDDTLYNVADLTQLGNFVSGQASILR